MPGVSGPHSLINEHWREYDFGGRAYRIDNPSLLFIGITTHRVVGPDATVHVVPAPGHFGCVVTYEPKDATDPVQF